MRRCTGNTGHAEVVRLTFDESKISFKKILDLFFKMHDPTQKDMQYPDIGTQYRSEIFYETEKAKLEASETLNELNKRFSGKYKQISLKLRTTVKLKSITKNILKKIDNETIGFNRMVK